MKAEEGKREKRRDEITKRETGRKRKNTGRADEGKAIGKKDEEETKIRMSQEREDEGTRNADEGEGRGEKKDGEPLENSKEEKWKRRRGNKGKTEIKERRREKMLAGGS